MPPLPFCPRRLYAKLRARLDARYRNKTEFRFAYEQFVEVLRSLRGRLGIGRPTLLVRLLAVPLRVSRTGWRRRSDGDDQAPPPLTHGLPAVTAEASMGDPIVLNSAPTYAAFGWLVLTGVLCAFLRSPLLVVAVLVGAFIVWVKLCLRFPRTMFVITAFLRGLLSKR